MPIFFAIILLALSFRSGLAQVPLFYQLLQAYQPQSLPINRYITTVSPPPTPIPTPKSTGQVLGATNVGGDGKIITLALLGDSMIDTLGPGIPTLEHSLSQYFPHLKFNLLNYGVGARDIEYGLYRLTNNYQYLGKEIPSLVSQNPDVVVVESFAYNNFGNTESGINRHWLALGAITSTLKQKLPQAKIVIAVTIAPNSIVFANGVKDLHLNSLDKIERTSTIKHYLQSTVNFANSQGFPLADAYLPSLFNHEGLKEFINTTDNIHPSISGAAFFSDTLADTLFKNKLIE